MVYTQMAASENGSLLLFASAKPSVRTVQLGGRHSAFQLSATLACWQVLLRTFAFGTHVEIANVKFVASVKRSPLQSVC